MYIKHLKKKRIHFFIIFKQDYNYNAMSYLAIKTIF